LDFHREGAKYAKIFIAFLGVLRGFAVRISEFKNPHVDFKSPTQRGFYREGTKNAKFLAISSPALAAGRLAQAGSRSERGASVALFAAMRFE
jgi:hypothetical protein